MSIDVLLSPTPPSRAAAAAGCEHCPLRRLPLFTTPSSTELEVIGNLKRAELDHEAGELLIAEGADDSPLFTLLAGWAFRYKTLADGRRQILNIMLPGDFIGLQQKMSDAASHGVRTLTPVRVCRFARDAVWTLHRELPSLGYDVTWLSANEGALLDDNLLSVGQRSALERVAALLLTLHARALPFAADGGRDGVVFPLTQQHIADAMGLSLVHAHRTLRQLGGRGLIVWGPGSRLILPDPSALARLAHLRWPLVQSPRPLI